ncbi:MAG: arsenate reductase ArsC [Kordiimonadaceae bacterium]|jgi:arsenate reductase (thioredoxin)|nr:arsenate reductase ArsC [Kordiimonadaceae bacterium]MBT6035045.1 arsenate reductase ArsC [Kordiimonadaceae bacterium]MBT6330255.1 arsenate reductase ArsC [Kordiimonadaceae bacterium]MBT7583591.1 arsenate reductase ArsC [Kordiimonadaceae bacterium]
MKILLICTHNACRSIIAEAVANKISTPRIIARSAGSSPRGHVHPLTLKHLARHGYDINNLKSQSWDEFENFSPDVVITLCDQAAGETCPVYFGNCLKIHWGLNDPSKNSENEVENFDNTITILENRFRGLLEEEFETMDTSALNKLFEKVCQ